MLPDGSGKSRSLIFGIACWFLLETQILICTSQNIWLVFWPPAAHHKNKPCYQFSKTHRTFDHAWITDKGWLNIPICLSPHCKKQSRLVETKWINLLFPMYSTGANFSKWQLAQWTSLQNNSHALHRIFSKSGSSIPPRTGLRNKL